MIFGTPSRSQPWGYTFFGHHTCLNFFFLGQQMVLSPFFIGAEPNVGIVFWRQNSETDIE